MHFRLCAASAVVSTPSSPERAAEVFRCPEHFVARDSTCRGRLPWLCILARRNDSVGPALGDGVVALAGIISPIGGDTGNVLIGRDLAQQFGQHASPVRSNRWRLPARRPQRRCW